MACDNCEIKNLIYQYADYVDRGDLAAVAALFRHGRVVSTQADGTESAAVGESAVLKLMSAFARIYPDDGTPHTMHMTTNAKIEVEPGGARARGQTYVIVFQAVEDFPLQPVIGVTYRDRFEKAETGWRFSERRMEARLLGDLSRHLVRPL